jgi:hypothetical protein
MPRPTKAPVDPDDAPLKRLGGGRWQTRDERFTIEPQSGTWVVVDAEQTDDFGMPLVRGPYPSLTAAKDAISGARTSGPATSPLVDRIAGRKAERKAAPPRGATAASKGATGSASSRSAAEAGAAEPGPKRSSAPAKGTPSKASAGEPGESAEPGWMRDLDAAERGRARRLIARLGEDGVTDAEGLVRRDLVGDVPAHAGHALGRRLAELGDDATPGDVAELLTDGRDERLGVRWRLVDGDGRPILLEPQGRRRR